MTGEPNDPAEIAEYEERLNDSINLLEEIWLKDNKFLVGDNLTVADLFGASDIEQPRKFLKIVPQQETMYTNEFISGVAGYNPRLGRPKLTAWLERVRNELNPLYDEAHVIVNKLANKYEKSQQASKP